MKINLFVKIVLIIILISIGSCFSSDGTSNSENNTNHNNTTENNNVNNSSNNNDNLNNNSSSNNDGSNTDNLNNNSNANNNNNSDTGDETNTTENNSNTNVIIQQTASSITQFGITWYFDKEYQYGQFANGDFWVLGPVTIIAIDPASEVVTENWTGDPYGPLLGNIERTVNGSMINPHPDLGTTQGYDSHLNMFPNDYDSHYDPTLNAARPNGLDLSDDNPLILDPSSSLISVISHNISELQNLGSGYGKSNLKTAAILTVLNSIPDEGSFRPSYVGNDKTVKFKKSDLDYSILRNLTPVEHAPDMAVIERYFERPWLDHIVDWYNTYIHPYENMHFYGGNIAREVGDGMLMLNLNYTDAQKEKLFIRMVQLGIDFTGFCDNGGYYPPRGGINLGRKIPILLAGYALGDNHMQNAGSWQINVSDSGGTLTSVFQEDSQLFYVSETSAGVYNYGYGGYGAEHVGMPEWSRRHEVNPEYHANVDFTADGYRVINGRALVAHALALRIMELKNAWNNQIFFDYHDRFWSLDYDPSPADGTYSHRYGAATNFARNMWEVYRSDYGPVWSN